MTRFVRVCSDHGCELVEPEAFEDDMACAAGHLVRPRFGELWATLDRLTGEVAHWPAVPLQARGKTIDEGAPAQGPGFAWPGPLHREPIYALRGRRYVGLR